MRTSRSLSPQNVPERSGQEQSPLSLTTQQIVRACVRCRKQKSKCDAFRPCTQCVKARATCINRAADEGEYSVPIEDDATKAAMRTRQKRTGSRPPKARKIAGPWPPVESACQRVGLGDQDTCEREADPPSPGEIYVTEESMNIQLFNLPPGHPMGSLSASTNQLRNPEAPALAQTSRSSVGCDSLPSPATSNVIDPQYQGVMPWPYTRASAASLLAHLPPRPVTDYLVAVYFNTVHWFMVVVHEGHFLHHYEIMMDGLAANPEMLSNTDEDFTFALLILTMVALGGRYTSMHGGRARRCQQVYRRYLHDAKPFDSPSPPSHEFDSLKAAREIFSVVRNNTTDSLACRNIATVQSSLLLGSLYLFHGDANLAWSHLGSTIRVAHSLGLHKEHSEWSWSSTYYGQMDHAERSQLKWRLFWAVHTGDRFLAMCYGLPPMISDEDCVADIPSEEAIYPLSGSSSYLMIDDEIIGQRCEHPADRRVTLLSYQTHKIQYYIILGDIISTLRRRATTQGLKGHVSKYENSASVNLATTGLVSQKGLIAAAHSLESKLQRWYNDIPEILRLSEDMTHPLSADWAAPEDDEIIIPASDDCNKHSTEVHVRRSHIKCALYGIQALLLRLAYENAMILIHRSILALNDTPGLKLSRPIYRRSMDACWRAALTMSNIERHHIFRPRQQVHAMSHVGIHLFTAGVILSAFAKSDPLSIRAWEAKKALRRVIRMQGALRRKAMISGQGLIVLESLARGILRKELQMLIATEPDHAAESPSGRRDDPIPGNPTSSARRNAVALSSASHTADWNTSLAPAPLTTTETTHPGPSGQEAGNVSDFGNEFFDEAVLELDLSALDIEKMFSDSEFLRWTAIDRP